MPRRSICFVLNKAVGLVGAREGKVPFLVFDLTSLVFGHSLWSFFIHQLSITSDPKNFVLNHVPNLVTNVGRNLVTNSDAV